MKNLITFILLCLTIGNLKSQDETTEKAKVKITTSPAYENDKRRTVVLNMMRDREGNIFIIKNEYKTFGKSQTLIEKYSPELKQKYSKDLEITGTGDRSHNFYSACTVGGEMLVFSTFFNKEKDVRYFFYSKVLDGGKLSKPQRISELPADGKYDGGFDLAFSSDSSKILVVNLIETKRKEAKKFSFTVLNSQMEEVWKNTVEMPFETRDVVLSDFAVDKEGRVFALASVDNDSKNKDDADILQEIFMYQQDSPKKPKRYILDMKKKMITQLRLHETPSGELVAVGIYASSRQRKAFFSRDRTSALGTVFVKIDPSTGEVRQKKLNDFSKKTFDFMKVKEKKLEEGKGIDWLRLESSWVGKDGLINLDLEQNWVVVTTYNRPNGFSSTTYHYYSQVAMLVRYNLDGTVATETVVPKRMESLNDKTGLGHIVSWGSSGGEVHFVFNDSPKNWGKKLEDVSDLKAGISPESGGIAFSGKKPQVVLCTVDSEGKRRFAQLFNFKKDDVFLNTESSLRYSENAFVVLGTYHKDFKLVKVEF